MAEQFNQELSLTGKIPCGLFNAMFEFSGCWQKDAAYTKTLAFDGMFITLYTVALEKSQMVLRDYVKKEVPSSWEPVALARYRTSTSLFFFFLWVRFPFNSTRLINVSSENNLIEPSLPSLSLPSLLEFQPFKCLLSKSFFFFFFSSK